MIQMSGIAYIILIHEKVYFDLKTKCWKPNISSKFEITPLSNECSYYASYRTVKINDRLDVQR